MPVVLTTGPRVEAVQSTAPSGACVFSRDVVSGRPPGATNEDSSGAVQGGLFCNLINELSTRTLRSHAG